VAVAAKQKGSSHQKWRCCTGCADRVRIDAGIWRYHPVRHEFEVFSEGTSNPWGVDFNDLGHAFQTACVIPHLYHVIPGARYQRQAGRHFDPFTFDDIKTIARHRHWSGHHDDARHAVSDDLGGESDKALVDRLASADSATPPSRWRLARSPSASI
jgi:hypothetical protein